MTMKEFYRALAETRNGWEIKGSALPYGPDETIRQRERCPLEVVAGVQGVFKAQKVLGLSSKQRYKIVCAADNYGFDFSLIVRKKLLKAVGLEE